MIMRMEKYYFELVSHTGRLLTNQMIWWSEFMAVNRKRVISNGT